MGYHSQRDVMFLKITLLLPKLLPSAKRVLEGGFSFSGHDMRSYQCYETNVDFDTRYMCSVEFGRFAHQQRRSSKLNIENR